MSKSRFMLGALIAGLAASLFAQEPVPPRVALLATTLKGTVPDGAGGRSGGAGAAPQRVVREGEVARPGQGDDVPMV